MLQVKETLYKYNKNGSVNQWSVFVEGNSIIVEFGKKGGKLQTKTTECYGKNLGKVNETSHDQQAELEAISKWNKQIKKGYTDSCEKPTEIKLPRKVEDYHKHKDKINFPATISPKLNGVNGEYRLLSDNTLVLKSRGGEVYPTLEHQVDEILYWMSTLNTKTLNGEIYKHGEWLQDITSAVKKPNKLTPQLEFHVFDIPDSKNIWADRIDKLAQVAEKAPNTFVKLVTPYQVVSHEDIQEYHNIFVESGFEGAIINNLQGVYKYNQRTSDVMKMKIPLSKEFKIVGYDVDKNQEPVLHCLIDINKDDTFKVKPKGTKEHRQGILKDIDRWLGEWLTVEFESYSKTGVPTKPVGVDKRKCTETGDPLE